MNFEDLAALLDSDYRPQVTGVCDRTGDKVTGDLLRVNITEGRAQIKTSEGKAWSAFDKMEVSK